MKVGVIIPAGGAGRRLGGRPKAELLLLGRPLLQLALEPFLSRSDVIEIVIALPASTHPNPPAWLRNPRVRLVAGGAERTDSVRAALEVLTPAADLVVIHDAARPLVTAELIGRVIAACEKGIGAVAALPSSDTIHLADRSGRIRRTLDRSQLWNAQTPQAFPRKMIEDAHEKALADRFLATDDAGLVLHYGGVVEVVEGERTNFKITLPEDIRLAEALLAQRA